MKPLREVVAGHHYISSLRQCVCGFRCHRASWARHLTEAVQDSRTISTNDELAALPPLTVIREVFRPSPSGRNYGAVWERRFQGSPWVCISGVWIDRPDPGPPTLPATVLWHPEDGAR